MGDPISMLAIGALAGAGVSIYQGEQQRKQQSRANAQAKEAATKTAAQAQEEANKADARGADVLAANAANTLAASSGQGSTMLTGAQGVDQSTLTLGKNTLLGG